MDLILKSRLETEYRELLAYCGYSYDGLEKNINLVIKDSISKFLKSCETPAIWCYGQHTKMLMADFVFEMKEVEYIIDENIDCTETEGFRIVKSTEINKLSIDGIIISSFRYRKEILDIIHSNYSDIKVLDIYEELQRQGIEMKTEYYNGKHPYNILSTLNRNIRLFEEKKDLEYARKILEALLYIKDFRLADIWATGFAKEFGETWNDIALRIRKVYKLQLAAMECIDSSNVLMLCFDGLRQRDIDENLMPQFRKYLVNNTIFYTNAYSVSTSTYESLIPAYGGYKDFSSEYYKKNTVKTGDCNFITEAIRQEREIYFYTDSYRFVEEEVNVTNYSQLATQKLWDFILDALGTDNGLFYLHILYETHYSYPNPYTKEEIVADGSNICFDYLKNNGGKLRTDYEKQHSDSLRYIDDTVTPFCKMMHMGVVFFADHGNVIYPFGTELQDTRYTDYTFGQDLIRIPLAIKYAANLQYEKGNDNRLMSLYSIGDIIIALLNKSCYEAPENKYVKIQRTQLYNPNFQYLMKKMNYEKGLNAFEAYIFEDGYKAVVYDNGEKELYSLEDEKIDDEICLCEKLKVVGQS